MEIPTLQNIYGNLNFVSPSVGHAQGSGVLEKISINMTCTQHFMNLRPCLHVKNLMSSQVEYIGLFVGVSCMMLDALNLEKHQ